MNCYRSSGSYGAERNRNVYHNGDGRKRTGAQKHRASHAEPNVDVTPAERDVASASGQCVSVVNKISVKKMRLLYCHMLIFLSGP